MNEQRILVDHAEGVATVTLNRPEAMNAFEDGMRERLLEALDSFVDDPAIRCIVITGAGLADRNNRRIDAVGPHERSCPEYDVRCRRLQQLPEPLLGVSRVKVQVAATELDYCVHSRKCLNRDVEVDTDERWLSSPS